MDDLVAYISNKLREDLLLFSYLPRVLPFRSIGTRQKLNSLSPRERFEAEPPSKNYVSMYVCRQVGKRKKVNKTVRSRLHYYYLVRLILPI